MPASPAPATLPPVDAHVHIVGIGAGETGCWLKADSLYYRIQAHFLCRVIGMDPATLRGDFDRLYVEHLLARLRASSLRAAVVLAQEQVHNPAGRVVPGAGLFHVPNTHVLRLGREHPEFFAGGLHPPGAARRAGGTRPLRGGRRGDDENFAQRAGH